MATGVLDLTPLRRKLREERDALLRYEQKLRLKRRLRYVNQCRMDHKAASRIFWGAVNPKLVSTDRTIPALNSPAGLVLNPEQKRDVIVAHFKEKFMTVDTLEHVNWMFSPEKASCSTSVTY